MTAFKAELRGDMTELRGDLDLGLARLTRTVVVGATASAISSWAMAVAVVGLT